MSPNILFIARRHNPVHVERDSSEEVRYYTAVRFRLI